MIEQNVDLIVWRNKAYFPALGKFPSGIYAAIEPVYVSELEVDAMVIAAKQVLTLGITQLSEVTSDEWRKRSDPILAATRARNWKELGRTGLSYGISWSEQQTRIDMSLRDKQGRWQNDPARAQNLPPNTALEDIMRIILVDVHSHPELLG